mmetsp:Transcript_34358/g.38944  ORF Transcript_34358/g.38944 Transcript_34358/m.38944 type:complete len:283 (+) Transcript_34358:190-1038(+)
MAPRQSRRKPEIVSPSVDSNSGDEDNQDFKQDDFSERKRKKTSATTSSAKDDGASTSNNGKTAAGQMNKREYKRLKYLDVYYNIGDFMMIYESKSKTSVAKLVKVIGYGADRKYPERALITVQWYYMKCDIPDKAFGWDGPVDFVSDAEVFETDHRDDIFVESIIGQCRVYTFEEYESLGQIPPNTYYSRARYELRKNIINPSPKAWGLHCTCKKPLKPDDFYIQCDQCQTWYHPEHIGMTHQEAQKLEDFLCEPCGKKGAGSKLEKSGKGAKEEVEAEDNE